KPAWESGRPRWFPPELDWVVGCSYRGMRTGRGPVRNFIGANMSFRREVLEDLHGFLTSLGRVGTAPLGCEETEFCLRVSQRYPDGVLLYEPTAPVSHRVSRPRTAWSRCRRPHSRGPHSRGPHSRRPHSRGPGRSGPARRGPARPSAGPASRPWSPGSALRSAPLHGASRWRRRTSPW